MSTRQSSPAVSPRRRNAPGACGAPHEWKDGSAPAEVPVLFTAPDLNALAEFRKVRTPASVKPVIEKNLGIEPSKSRTPKTDSQVEVLHDTTAAAAPKVAPEKNTIGSPAPESGESTTAPSVGDDSETHMAASGERKRIRVPLRQRRTQAESPIEPWYRRPSNREWMGKLGATAIIVLIVMALAHLFSRSNQRTEQASPVQTASPQGSGPAPQGSAVQLEPSTNRESGASSPSATVKLAAPLRASPTNESTPPLEAISANRSETNSNSGLRREAPAIRPLPEKPTFPETSTPSADSAYALPETTSAAPTYPTTSPSTYRFPAETAVQSPSPGASGGNAGGVASLDGTIEPTPIQKR